MKSKKTMVRGLVVCAMLLITILLVYRWIGYCKHYIERHLDERTFLP
jgi:uncharacterized membrane protein